jgi:dihydrofolate synthase/folylpolyglutamate synthase
VGLLSGGSAMKNRVEVIEWIEGLLPFGIKPGLERMELMLDRLGHPEKKIKSIHVGGTNGKGSTISFLRHVLEEAGYFVGTFTSPAIELYEDQISVNGTPISEEDLVVCAERVRPIVNELSNTKFGSPTEFEVLTTMAFDYFANRVNTDVVLIEVGLGGRMDSTNVIMPMLSIITSIGFDHMHFLGDSLIEIATEKAGIIKPSIPVVSGVKQKEAIDIIKRKAVEKEADICQIREDFTETIIKSSEQKQVFRYDQENKRMIELTIQMAGPHQRENAAVALCALEILKNRLNFSITTKHIQKGFFHTTWPGRFEKMQESPLVIFDGAHNKEGMESLAKTLEQHFPTRNYRFLVAATKEKDMSILLQPFKGWKATFTLTSFDFERAAKAFDLFNEAKGLQRRYDLNWERALLDELKSTGEDEMLIVCGSLYFISQVRKKWNTITMNTE